MMPSAPDTLHDRAAAPGGPDPAPAEIATARARILASGPFRRAPRLAAFLDFVVGRALAGEAGGLKGYVIATEALGRGPDFDPATDPIVRVEAGRLRRALEAYYEGEGRDDPVRVGVPRGGYAPVFARRASLGPSPEMGPAAGSGTCSDASSEPGTGVVSALIEPKAALGPASSRVPDVEAAVPSAGMPDRASFVAAMVRTPGAGVPTAVAALLLALATLTGGALVARGASGPAQCAVPAGASILTGAR